MKCLVVADETTAVSKLQQAFREKHPNRRMLQLAAHNANPKMYDHPDTLRNFDTAMIGVYAVANDGRCELLVHDHDAQFFNITDRNKMTDGLTIASENIKERKPK